MPKLFCLFVGREREKEFPFAFCASVCGMLHCGKPPKNTRAVRGPLTYDVRVRIILGFSDPLPLVTVPFTQLMSSVITLWTTPFPSHCGRLLCMVPYVVVVAAADVIRPRRRQLLVFRLRLNGGFLHRPAARRPPFQSVGLGKVRLL